MGYLEHNWQLSNDQAINTQGYNNGTDIIDLRENREIGRGRPLYLMTRVTEAFSVTGTSGTGGSLIIYPVYAADTALLSNVVAGASAQLFITNSLNNLTINSTFYIPIAMYQYGDEYTPYAADGTPTLTSPGLRYFGVRYSLDLAGNTYNTGKVSTWLTLDQPATPPIYPASTNT